MNTVDDLSQTSHVQSVVYKPFGEIGQYVRGVTYNKSQEVLDSTSPGIKLLRANNITLSSSTLNFDDVKVISDSVKVKETQYLHKNDILICAGSGSKQHIGKVAYIESDMDYTFGGFMAVLRCSPQVSSRFLFHVLTSNSFSKYLEISLNSTTINNLNSSLMNEFVLPIPSIEEQVRIVAILDKFTTLLDNLNLELSLRKKQYEYYRNELLSFTSSDSQICDSMSSNTRSCNEVKYVPLEAVLEYEQPGKFIVKSTDYDDANAIPVLTAGQSFILGYTAETDNVYSASKDNPCIIFDDFTTSFHWVDFDFKIKSSAMKILRPSSNEVSFKYVYYAMSCIKYKPSEHARQWISKYSKFTVPLPSLKEQERIVAILDNFYTLINDQEKGLPAEIRLVQKQYEYYREKLLTF